MNLTSSPGLMEALQATKAPFGPRAVLAWIGDDGAVEHKYIERGQSVVNIEADLRSHLEAKPRTDAWLTDLRDYLTDWLKARADAAKFGGIVMPVDEAMTMGVASWKR